jgi:putative membrane protein
MSSPEHGESGLNLSLTNTQLSWMRSDLSNLRTLMAWVRTAVSMIGFGFTIYNFYKGFLQELTDAGRGDAARNLGVALVAAGTISMVIALWNFWTINHSLEKLAGQIALPSELRHRWAYSYVIATLVMGIGLVTLVFMLRHI